MRAFGFISWQKSLGGSGVEYAHSITQDSNGDYFIVGESSSSNGDVTSNNGNNDFWMVKLTPTGNIVWEKSIGGTGDDRGYSMQRTLDGGIITAGRSFSNNGDVTGNNGSSDFWVVKLNNPVGINELSELNIINVFPNPTSSNFTIEGLTEPYNLTIYNSLGQLLFSENNVLETSKKIDISKYSKGLLFIKIEADGNMISKKILKQ